MKTCKQGEKTNILIRRADIAAVEREPRLRRTTVALRATPTEVAGCPRLPAFVLKQTQQEYGNLVDSLCRQAEFILFSGRQQPKENT